MLGSKRSIPTFLIFGGISLFAACAPSAPLCPPSAFTPFQAPTPATPPAPPSEREKVAVLPIDDDDLFRAERAALRFELGARLFSLAPQHEFLSLPEVDAKIRPVSKSSGNRCAFEGEPLERRARGQGWLTTEILFVAGLPKEKRGEALWVRVSGAGGDDEITFEGPWNPQLGIVDRYRAAFAGLARIEGGGLLGGILGSGGGDTGAWREGAISICEKKSFFACEPGSADWKDKAPELAACFAGEDEATRELLVQSDAGQTYCEMVNLQAAEGREGAREACLCRALAASAGMRVKPGRRKVRVDYESVDLQGKPRPELRVVESSTNLHTEDEWHSMRSVVDGKTQYTSIRRLSVDNLDALAAPLARCQSASASVVVADVDIREDGVPLGGKIVAGAPAEREAAQCIEAALGRGAFSCTSDGKPARVRVSIQMAGR